MDAFTSHTGVGVPPAARSMQDWHAPARHEFDTSTPSRSSVSNTVSPGAAM